MAVKNITIATAQAKDVVAEMIMKSIIPTSVTKDNTTGLTTITADLTPEQEKELTDTFAKAGGSVIDAVKDGMDTVVEFAADVTDTAVRGIGVQLINVGVKAAASGVRIAAEATAKTGASVINNLITQSIRAANEISNDKECNDVKKNFGLLKAKFTKKTPVFKIS
jgi:hypothetical protein